MCVYVSIYVYMYIDTYIYICIGRYMHKYVCIYVILPVPEGPFNTPNP